MVNFDAVLKLVGEELLGDGILNLPDIKRIEPEVGLALRAEGNLLLTVLNIALAVVPKTDGVEILQLIGLGDALESLEELVV